MLGSTEFPKIQSLTLSEQLEQSKNLSESWKGKFVENKLLIFSLRQLICFIQSLDATFHWGLWINSLNLVLYDLQLCLPIPSIEWAAIDCSWIAVSFSRTLCIKLWRLPYHPDLTKIYLRKTFWPLFGVSSFFLAPSSSEMFVKVSVYYESPSTGITWQGTDWNFMLAFNACVEDLSS